MLIMFPFKRLKRQTLARTMRLFTLAAARRRARTEWQRKHLHWHRPQIVTHCMPWNNGKEVPSFFLNALASLVSPPLMCCGSQWRGVLFKKKNMLTGIVPMSIMRRKQPCFFVRSLNIIVSACLYSIFITSPPLSRQQPSAVRAIK